MKLEKIKVSFIGMETDEKVKKYILEKISKYDKLIEMAISGSITFKSEVATRGVKDDYRLDINFTLPKSVLHVEEVGSSPKAMSETAADTVGRRYRRYIDKLKNWEGKKPWKVLEAEDTLNGMEDGSEEDDDYIDYFPRITERKKMSDMSPLQEGEAIEKMEMMGFDQLLFKSAKSGSISMVYRRKDGTYGIIEPKNGV